MVNRFNEMCRVEVRLSSAHGNGTDFSFVSTDYGSDLGKFVDQITVDTLTEPKVIVVRSWGDDVWVCVTRATPS